MLLAGTSEVLRVTLKEEIEHAAAAHTAGEPVSSNVPTEADEGDSRLERVSNGCCANDCQGNNGCHLFPCFYCMRLECAMCALVCRHNK